MTALCTRTQAEEIKNLLGRLNLWRKKPEIVKEYSLTNSTHLHELTELEATRMIADLKGKVIKADNMRKALLSIGYQLHWDTPRSSAEHMMERKRINFNRVNDYFQKDPHSKFKKKFTHMDPWELNDAVKQLQQVLNATKK
jgi:hypothetical protein